MSWFGPPLDADQRALVGVLDELIADRAVVLSDDADLVGNLIGSLAEMGVWTIGVDEEHGGGGADHAMTALAFERLGRSWPALGWAAAQAHVAMDVVGGRGDLADLVARVNGGEAAIAVVEAGAPHVELDVGPDRVAGTVARVDVASLAPHLLVLDGAGPGTAVLVMPEGLAGTRELRRTGLAGAMTVEASVDARAGHHTVISGVDVGRARRRLWLLTAAVALGIAAAATDDALAYCATRHQFGAPLNAITTVRQSLLDQAARTAVTLRAVLAEPTDDVEAWAVLRDAAETAIAVATKALQAHGGYGYLAEYPVERRLRDAVSLRAASAFQVAAPTVGRALVAR